MGSQSPIDIIVKEKTPKKAPPPFPHNVDEALDMEKKKIRRKKAFQHATILLAEGSERLRMPPPPPPADAYE